jgi:hypothetical protein
LFRSSRERVAWFTMTILLGLELRFDFLGVLENVYKATFQADSDALIQTTMLDANRGLFDPIELTTGGYYNSQFGLHGMVMAAASPGLFMYSAMHLLTAMLTAAVLATAVIACWRAWGGRAAVVLLVLLTVARWFNAFGSSTYWQLWTLLLPLLVPLLVWPRLGSGRRKWLRGGALIAGLIFLKALCGYEYMSTLVIGAAASVAFHEFRGRVDRTLLVKLVGTMAAGVAGFVVALGVHVTQLLILYGDVSVLDERINERTFSPSTIAVMLGWARNQHDPVRDWMVRDDSVVGLWGFQMVGYLRDPAIALPGSGATGIGPLPYGIPIWIFVVVFAVLAWQAWRGRTGDAQIQRRLALAGGMGLVGAMSWLVLAYGHMIHHPHLNAIAFHLPFLPFVFAMIAMRAQQFWLRVWPGKKSPGAGTGDVASAGTGDVPGPATEEGPALAGATAR